MAVTYVFSVNTRIQSAQVNQDFADIVVTEWSNWTPSILKTDGVTVLPGTILIARYCVLRKVCFGTINTSNDCGDPAGVRLNFTLPVATYSAAQSRLVGSGYQYDGAYDAGYVGILDAVTTYASVYKRVLDAWSGSGNGFAMSFSYEIP